MLGDIFCPTEQLKTCKRCSNELKNCHHNKKVCDDCSKKLFCSYCGEKSDKLIGRGKQRCLKCAVKHSHTINDNTNSDDWVECSCCGFRSTEISTHIISIHGKESSKSYIGSKKAKISCDRLKGEKNPAHDHGGKFSPFSKKFIKYKSLNEEEINNTVKGLFDVAKVTRNSNNNCQTRESYWVEKYGEVEGKKLYIERQSTFTIEKCIEKHGPVNGYIIWKNRQDGWQETLNDKPQEEIERINRLKMKGGGSISKAEIEILNFTKENGIEANNQFCLVKENKKIFLYDIQYNNKIIEYNGDYWHCNPKYYTPDFYHPNKKIKANDIWETDKNKNDFAIMNGFEVKIIWEHDFKLNKQKVLQECLDYLKQ